MNQTKNGTKLTKFKKIKSPEVKNIACHYFPPSNKLDIGQNCHESCMDRHRDIPSSTLPLRKKLIFIVLVPSSDYVKAPVKATVRKATLPISHK